MKTHVIKQGESLGSIAKDYNLPSGMALYEHESNKAFRELRKNPNIIYPGDEINIPESKDFEIKIDTGRAHKIMAMRKKPDYFRLKIQDSEGQVWAGKRVCLKLARYEIDTEVGEDGLIEIELKSPIKESGKLDVYLDPESPDPTHSFEVMVGYLDPIDTVSGLQARLNQLGFDAGVVDGISGQQTKTATKAFQSANELDVDGIAGPKTRAKLEEVYGC